MAETPRFLTSKDLEIFQRLVERINRTPPPLHSGLSLGEDSQAPEVYVARVPASGIPAMAVIRPGRATCDIYQLLRQDVPQVMLAFSSVEVHNVSFSEISGDSFIIVVRDKYGTWLAIHSLAHSPETDGFTGCKTIYDLCSDAYESWHFISGVLASIDSVPCEECQETSTTGTGTGANDCPCIPGDCYTVSFSGVIDGPGSTAYPIICRHCDLLRSSIQLRRDTFYAGPADGCLLASEGLAICESTLNGATIYFVLLLRWIPEDSLWRLSIWQPGAGFVHATYIASSWDCDSPLSLVLESNDDEYCTNWPSIAVLRRDCSSPTTGTGTQAETGTGTSLPPEEPITTTCCAEAIPATLSLAVVSGCSGAATPRVMTYDALGALGPMWYTEIETANGHQLYWAMECAPPVGEVFFYVYSVCDGVINSAVCYPVSCSPFDSGNVSLALTIGSCCGGINPTLRITE